MFDVVCRNKGTQPDVTQLEGGREAAPPADPSGTGRRRCVFVGLN